MSAANFCRTAAVFALLVLLAQCSRTQEPRTVTSAAHRVVIVFGDSIALGAGASTPDKGFAGLLFQRVQQQASDARFTDFAVAGSVANDVLRKQLPFAAHQHPTDVWLCVGTNDVRHGTPTAAFASTERKLLDSIAKRWPAARIVVFGIPDLTRSPLLSGVKKLRYSKALLADDDAERRVARADRANFVDVLSISDQSSDVAGFFATDGIHPDDAGHAAIADAATKAALVWSDRL